MSLRTTMAFFMATQFVAADYAAASIDIGAEKWISPTGVFSRQEDLNSALAVNNWYSLNKTVSVTVLEREGAQDNVNVAGLQQLLLVEGTEINVMELSADGRQALIGIDEDGLGENNAGIDAAAPVIAWVSVDELTRGKLDAVDAEGLELFGASQFADKSEKSEYVSTDLARRGGGHARRRGGRGRRGGGMTYCLRDVRLAAARFTRAVPQGIAQASSAYPRYRAAGWRPTSYGPSNPIGTACFFGGGRRKGCAGGGCGHAAIKISANAWKGAGVRPTPFLPSRPGKVYSFHGCLIPPGK